MAKNTHVISLPCLQHWLGLFLCVLLFWATLWGLLGSDALPGGHLFAFVIVIFASYIAGQLIKFVKCPPLLGMLLMGFILRNVPYIDVAKSLNPELSSACRSFALVVILIRAGTSLDSEVLKKLSGVCTRLAFTPCLVEATICGIVAHYLLNLPWLWSFMLGFVLGAVSPAVVVPCMLGIHEKGLGVKKGIPTLVIAAASVDDVLAITGFGILLGVTFSTGSLIWTIFKGPVEAILGTLYGIAFGVLFWYIPNRGDSHCTIQRVLLLLLCGCVGLFGSQRLDLPGVGALACLAVAFTAAYNWRKHENSFDQSSVIVALSGLWSVLQPALFGLIGAELDIDQLESKTVFLGLATLCIGLIFRLLTTFVVVVGAGLSMRERLFIALAWIPKATVQAAIGPVALDLTRTLDIGEEAEELAIRILTVAVLSILLTAPFGALAITLSAPKLLEAHDVEDPGIYQNYQEGTKVEEANETL